jgi:hypothetical protein
MWLPLSAFTSPTPGGRGSTDSANIGPSLIGPLDPERILFERKVLRRQPELGQDLFVRNPPAALALSQSSARPSARSSWAVSGSSSKGAVAMEKDSGHEHFSDSNDPVCHAFSAHPVTPPPISAAEAVTTVQTFCRFFRTCYLTRHTALTLIPLLALPYKFEPSY